MNRYFTDERVKGAELGMVEARRLAANGKPKAAALLYKACAADLRTVASECGEGFPHTRKSLEDSAAWAESCAAELDGGP